jgi:hypothetical protein
VDASHGWRIPLDDERRAVRLVGPLRCWAHRADDNTDAALARAGERERAHNGRGCGMSDSGLTLLSLLG